MVQEVQSPYQTLILIEIIITRVSEDWLMTKVEISELKATRLPARAERFRGAPCPDILDGIPARRGVDIHNFEVKKFKIKKKTRNFQFVYLSQ